MLSFLKHPHFLSKKNTHIINVSVCTARYFLTKATNSLSLCIAWFGLEFRVELDGFVWCEQHMWKVFVAAPFISKISFAHFLFFLTCARAAFCNYLKISVLVKSFRRRMFFWGNSHSHTHISIPLSQFTRFMHFYMRKYIWYFSLRLIACVYHY